MPNNKKLLSRIEEIVQRTLLFGTSARIIPRGVVRPLDQFARGTVRFGKKIGYLMPLIAPENKYILNDDAVYGTNQIILDRSPTWMSAGGYISINNTEIHVISDVVDNTVIIEDTLLADHPEGQPVYHHSAKIVVEGNYTKGKTIINVDTPYLMTIGDIIGITSSETLNNFIIEYTITNLTQTGSNNNTLQYQITIDKELHRDIFDDDEIQLLAYPAYFSDFLTIPGVSAEYPIIGPFLLDWASGNLSGGLSVEEVQTIQQYNGAHTPIGEPQVINKNHQILYANIRADQMLFWDVVAGSVNYHNNKHSLVAELNNDGEWWIKYTCVPEIQVPYSNAKGYIICVSPTQMINNDAFILSDYADTIVFDYKVDATHTTIPSSASVGILTAASIPADNDTFTLDDGFGTTTTFEFKRTGSFVPSDYSYRTVDITSALLTTDVAIAMVQEINNVTILALTAVNTGPQVTITNDNISSNGNTIITVTGTGITITQQFIGGTDPVIVIDISGVATDIEVAELTAAAINGSNLNITAIWPVVSPSVQLTSGDQGTLGNIPITEFVSASGFIVNGMSGGSGGAQWNFKVESDNDILLRIRLYPNDFVDYNITGGTTTSIPVILSPTEKNVERIDILIQGKENTNVYIYDWVINGNHIVALKHSYVARVYGDYNFASTTLLAKPLLPSLEDLKVHLDSGTSMNSGHMRL